MYEHDTFKFKPTNLGVNDFIEIVYIKNIRNEVLPIDQEHKTDETYLKRIWLLHSTRRVIGIH